VIFKFEPVDRKGEWKGPPAWPFVGVVLLIIALGLEVLSFLPAWMRPPCGFHAATGHPCPTCGATRSGELMIHLHFMEAIKTNPLFFLVVAGLLLWVVVGATARLVGKRFSIDIPQKATKWWLLILFTAFLINWAYLWIAGI